MSGIISFSAYGEDSMVLGVLQRISSMNDGTLLSKNTYIDVGCYHPQIDNNTFIFYNIGWRGTLVDPNPIVKSEIDKIRPDDQFLQVAVDSQAGEGEFMMFSEVNTTNTLDKEFAERLKKSSGNEIKKTITVQTITLDDVFKSHIKRFNSVPILLNIDIEGLDYKVISSYSFEYRPLFILIEDEILGSFEGSKIKTFMETKGYSVVSSNFLTALYMDNTNSVFPKLKKLGYYDTID